MKEERTKKVEVYVCEGCGYEWESKQWTCQSCGGDVGVCCGIAMTIKRYERMGSAPARKYGTIDLYYHPHCFGELQKFLGNVMNINLLSICKPEGDPL